MRLLKKDDSRVLALYGAATLGLLALVVIVIGLGVLPVARAASDTLYTFETGVEGWQPCTASSCASDSSAVTVTQSLSHTTEGSYSLRLDFDQDTSTHTNAILYHLNILGECRSDWQSDLLLPLLFEKIRHFLCAGQRRDGLFLGAFRDARSVEVGGAGERRRCSIDWILVGVV